LLTIKEGIHDANKTFTIAQLWLARSLSKEIPELDLRLGQAFLPTRVLDLGRDAKEERNSRGLGTWFRSKLPPPPPITAPIRLVSPEARSSGQYLTLSHRWGQSQQFKLTSATIESFHKNIPFNSLPKTFQDAVIVTRNLGYRYLWIDALCIVQDDLQEWRSEAPKMASIYHNSTCTIAAHTAKSDSEGFLEAAFENIPSIKLTSLHESAGTSSSTSRFPHLYLGGSFKDQVNESFLTKRGWVFQERILPRRILHFTRHRVFFEDGSGVQTIDADHNRTPLTHSPREDQKFMIEHIVATSTDWYKMVERYSICALTFDHDRLPAIAGIAAYVRAYDSADEYLFGIWSKSLQQGLLWLVADDSPQEVFYEPGRAPPSWSWARWNGHIRFPLFTATCKPLFQLVDGFISPEDGLLDSSPEETRPFLSMKADVMELENVKVTISGRYAGQFSFGRPMGGLYYINSNRSGIADWMAFDGERQDTICFPNLSCVLVSLLEDTTWVYDEERGRSVAQTTQAWYFLILGKTGEKSEGYRRVGIGAKYRHRPKADFVTRTIRIE